MRTLVAALLLISAFQGERAVTDAQIEEAIALGLQKKSLAVTEGAREYTIIAAGPMGRIAQAARAAAQALRPFTPKDVTAEMAGAFLRISAFPDKPALYGSRWHVVAPATNIVIFPKGTRDLSKAIQPTSKEPFPQTWSNAVGAKFEGQGMTADFDLKTIPAGDFDVVVGCECSLEARATIKAKDRAKLK